MTAGRCAHIYPGEPPRSGFQPSFAAALASALGSRAPDRAAALYYRLPKNGAPAIRTFPAQSRGPTGRVVRAVGLFSWVPISPIRTRFERRFRSPRAAPTMAGIFIHAQALAQILDGAQFPPSRDGSRRRSSSSAAALGVALPFLPLRAYWKGAIGLGVVGAYWSLGFAYFAAGGALLPLLSPTLSLVLAVAFGITYARRRDQLEKGIIRSAFGRYVSPQIIEQVLRDPSKLALGGEKREMSFVFSDLEGFTTLAESYRPRLRSRCSRVTSTECCESRSRTAAPSIASSATASPCSSAPRSINPITRGARSLALWRGIVTAKPFGGASGERRLARHHSHRRAHGLGDRRQRGHRRAAALHSSWRCVNTAARLEGANRYLGTRVCISAEVARHSPEQAFVPIGRLVLKGRSQEIECVTVGHHLSGARSRRVLVAYRLLDVDRAACEERFEALARNLPEPRPAGLSLAAAAARRIRCQNRLGGQMRPTIVLGAALVACASSARPAPPRSP